VKKTAHAFLSNACQRRLGTPKGGNVSTPSPFALSLTFALSREKEAPALIPLSA
jgi:hypothetical protein